MSLTDNMIELLLQEETAKLSVHQRRKAFYDKFDLAAIFLLDLLPDNLFEPADGKGENAWLFRCKGCSEVIPRTERKNHHSMHSQEYRLIGSD